MKTYILPDFTDFRPPFDLYLAKLYLAELYLAKLCLSKLYLVNFVFASATVQFWAPYRSAFLAEGGVF